MDNTIINQAYLFLIFILNGIFIGIMFDIFRILRKSFKTPNFITYVEDVIFWILVATSVLYTLFVFNNGEIRGYIFIGLIIGVILYILIFSKPIVKISVHIITFFKKILYKILKVTLYPIKCIINILKKILGLQAKNVSKCLKSIKNNCKKCQNLKNKSKRDENSKNKEGF